MCSHGKDLGDDNSHRPLDSENIGQTLKIDSGSFSNTEYVVAQPRKTQITEPLVEESLTKLRSQ